MSLKEYSRKRDFKKTSEPAPDKKSVAKKGPLRFVVQMHQASRLHYDFRLEMQGVLKSWAVPKGPSLDPHERRLAILVEDHPIKYGSFEGIIPKGNYGAGTVMIWDKGTYQERNSKNRAESEQTLKAGLAKGHITFILKGKKLRGEFALVHLKTGNGRAWLLVKKADEFASSKLQKGQDRSVRSGRSLEEISKKAPLEKAIWISNRSKARVKPELTPRPALLPRPGDRTRVIETASQRKVLTTHRDRIFWAEEKLTKGDLIDYYQKVSPWILPHLKDRPQSLHRHPRGSQDPGFFQKDMIGYLPRWIKTHRIHSESAGKSVNYLLCQDEAALLYLINLGCIELNPWLSRVGSLDKPDFSVIDLDPDQVPFSEVIKIAQAFHKLLDQLGAENYCKTSGSRGLHICVPCGARYDYTTAREFALRVCEKIHSKFPATTSLVRDPAKRRGKIYLDFLQNREGQTLAAPYSVRPRPLAPVSTPLLWKEVTLKLNPQEFNIKTVLKRLEKKGDLWAPLLKSSVNLSKILKKISSDNE